MPHTRVWYKLRHTPNDCAHVVVAGGVGIMALNQAGLGEQPYAGVGATPAKPGQHGAMHDAGAAIAREGHMQHVAQSPFRPLRRG